LPVEPQSPRCRSAWQSRHNVIRLLSAYFSRPSARLTMWWTASALLEPQPRQRFPSRRLAASRARRQACRPRALRAALVR
jgi:hypothetical protein